MASREDQSGFKLNSIKGTARQDNTCRKRRFWVALLAALMGHMPAYGASGQAGFVCSETAVTTANASATPVHQAWPDAMLVFDFDRKLIFHGDGSESYPLHKVRDDVITWRSESGELKGFFNRRTLEAGEFHSRSGALTHRAYGCRLHSYLSLDLKP